MAVEYVDSGNDDGSNFGRSDGKIGFYGLATPIVKPTLDCVATTTATTTLLEAEVDRIQAVLAALGLVTLG